MTKNRIKTIIAFSLLIIVVIVGFSLSILDSRKDVYPDENTNIRLYGEAHGLKEYYDIEFESWKAYYDEGYRALFVELPYYTAEYLNLWMRDDSDEIIDQIFEDIQGTQSGNEHYYEFFHEIKDISMIQPEQGIFRILLIKVLRNLIITTWQKSV